VRVVLELGDLLNLGGSNGETLEDLTDVGALLHGNDSELILLVNPDEESLGVVVEDTTALGPFTLKTAGLEVLVATLEEEVVSDKGVTLSGGHFREGVVLALKVTIKGIKSLDDQSLSLKTVFSADGGSEGEISEITCNTDSGRVDHCVLISWEVGAVKLVDVHGGNVLISGLVAVVSLNNLVHEGSEIVVRFVGTSVHTDTRVGPLSSREDCLLETESILVLSVLAFLPNFLGEALVQKGVGTSGEEWHGLNVIGVLKVITHHGAVDVTVGNVT